MGRSIIYESVVAVLEQGLQLLDRLDEADYGAPVPEASNASIGAHYRHCIEHFEQVLHRKLDEVNYDARNRDRSVESSRNLAMDRTQRLIDEISGFDRDPDELVEVCCALVNDDCAVPLVKSTLAREVSYAVIHAIHHYAMIGMMCRVRGVEVPEGFGMAPSTQRHQRALEEAG